jgi:hypothetical protein
MELVSNVCREIQPRSLKRNDKGEQPTPQSMPEVKHQSNSLLIQIASKKS